MAKNGMTPRKRKRSWNRMAKKDRRNLKMWADGARESVLKPHIPGYTDALERGWRAERDYVLQVCNEFHARIPWRLEDEEEPEEPLPEYDQFATPEVEELDAEEMAAKRLRIETLNARIGRWLKYRARKLRRPTRMDRSRDPFAVMVAKLAGINTPPKARQAFQQYMHEAYDAEIAPAVAARWAATNVEEDGTTLKTKKGPGAPFRAQVARELFSELSEEEQAGLRQRAQDEAKVAREEYVKAMKNPPSKTPEARQKCIDALGPFVARFMAACAEYTGLSSFTVFGGPMPEFGGELRTITVSQGRNHGPTPCHFPQWSKARFNRDVLDFMKEWLHTAYTPVECAEAAMIPGENDPPLANKLLGRAKYTIRPDGEGSDDSESDSSSSSSSEGSDSDSESDCSDSELEQAVGKTKGKKQREKEKLKKKKQEKKEKNDARETAAAGKMGGKKRKSDEAQREGAAKRARPEKESGGGASSPPEIPVPVGEPQLTLAQQREINIANNKKKLAEVDAAWRAKHPETAAALDAAKEKKNGRPKPKPRAKKAAEDGQVRRSNRLNAGDEGEGSGHASSSGDIEMEDVGSGGSGGGSDGAMEVTPHAELPPPPPPNDLPPPPPPNDTPPPPPPNDTPPPLPPNDTPPLPPNGVPLSPKGAPPPLPPNDTSSPPLPPNGAPPLPPNGVPLSPNGAPPPLPPNDTSSPPLPPNGAPPPNGTVASSQDGNVPPLSQAAAAMLGRKGKGSSSGSGARSGSSEASGSADTAATSASGQNEVVSGVPPCPEEAEDWFKARYAEVSKKDLGDSFNAVLRLFIELERGYGWTVGAVRGLSPTNRPSQVASWVSLGRGGRGGWISNGVGPKIESLAVFDRAWWAWWKELQPKWRGQDGGRPGRFTRDTYPPRRKDNWSSLRHPGQNGILSLVATLYWWGKAVEQMGEREDRESWAEAVTDVKWMLRGLLDAEGGGGDGGAATENESDQLRSD